MYWVEVPTGDRALRLGPVPSLAAAYAAWPFLPRIVTLVDAAGKRTTMPPWDGPPQPTRPPALTPGQQAWRDRQRQRSRSAHLKRHWTTKYPQTHNTPPTE